MPEKTNSNLVDHPAQLLRMGKRLMESGRIRQAGLLARMAVAERPDDALIRAIAETISTHRVPRFHQSMLQDGPRNRVYRRSIEEEIRGRRVLDIGTGSGLLAMMAARAGAAHVYACELDARLAATAREIVEQNGLGDRITVLAAHSTKLDRNKDLGGGVDLVISEVFGSDLLAEGALAALRDARARLCLPAATFLPGRASIRVALAECAVREPHTRVDAFKDVEGFDISLFGRHVRRHRSFEAGDPKLHLRSAPADLFSFDFSGDTTSEDRAAITCIAHGGLVTGILQWIAFESLSGHRYENAPEPEARSHWWLNHYALETPIETLPGDRLVVHGWRDDQALLCWAGP